MNINFKKILLSHIFINFTKLLSNSEIYATYLKSFTGKFCDITEPNKLFTSQYLRYDHSLFLS